MSSGHGMWGCGDVGLLGGGVAGLWGCEVVGWGAATHTRGFCLDFFGMFRHFWNV